ncbi:MAG: helix-turn-helix transcriptional regulator [Lachnospiraceae bacterium]|nr:helix-turn-helix transcriptional regulator [Lachnospiraceae bacterium]
MSEIATIVGQRLRQRRQELGYSQELTSEKAGLHPTYIGQVERGEKNATIESIEKICIALDLPMEDLFNKIITTNSKYRTAQKCYDLIISQPMNDQENLYILLEDIIKYKHN